MRRMLVLLALLTVVGVHDAAACRRCGHPGRHHARRAVAHPCPPCPPAPAPAPIPPPAAHPSLGAAILEGFELSAGFRWDRCSGEDEDRQFRRPVAPARVHDPFFVGAQIRLPVAEGYGIFVRGERDWTEAPRGNVALGLYFQPFYREDRK